MKRMQSYAWLPCSFAVMILAAVVAAQFSAPDVSAQPANQDRQAQPGQPNQPTQPLPPNQDRVLPQDRTTAADRPDTDQLLVFKATDLVGVNVATEANREKDIGEIEDLMIREDGKIVYAAVSFGGFLGMGDKLFAVPWEAVHLARRADPDNPDKFSVHARIDVTEQTLKDRPGFKKDSWPTKADESFLRRRIGTAPLQNPAK